jgi:cobalt-zinc-cadmium efflux system protein
MAMDAAPASIDVEAVRAFLAAQPGVAAVHDLHVWRHSAAATSLTAHLVAPEGVAEDFLAGVSKRLRSEFGIAHATVQVESAAGADCPAC